MTRSPIVDFRTMERILRKIGFDAVRQKASHVFYRHPDGRTTTVPKHPGRDLSRALTREILREVGLTPEEFFRLLEEG
jgi:predicted RNA binding protein YcfA (HicA-like mRNA interferase family)